MRLLLESIPPIALFALSGCTGGGDAPLASVRGDTIIVNSRSAVQLPIPMLGAGGRMLRSWGLRYERVAGDRVGVTRDGRVTCDRNGDARVRVSRFGRSTELVVRCRPVRGFRVASGFHLAVAGQPQDLDVGAVGLDNAPVTLVAGKASVRDTTVAYLHEGRVYPRTRGATFVDVQVGDCWMPIPVQVIEEVAGATELRPYQEYASSLRLVGGEIRSWHIAPGRYEFRLRADSIAHEGLLLAGLGMNCAPYPDGGQHYSCVAPEGSTVIVRHPRPPQQGTPLAAELSIRRLPDPDDSAFVRNEGGSNENELARARRATLCPRLFR